MFKVTPDTNILVSGLVYRRGKPFELLLKGLSGELKLTVSQHILDEMADVMARKFEATPEEIAEAIHIVTDAARIVRPAVQLDVIKEDPSDNHILECAVSAGSDYIVTGDKDLLRIGSYDSIRIVNVADFLEVVKSTGRDV